MEKTTLRQLVNEIDFTNKISQTWSSLDEIGALFEIYGYLNDSEERLKGYFIRVWNCTDTWVGTVAHFLDGEFVMISKQEARKSGTDYEFVSEEAGIKVRDYIYNLIDKKVEPFDIITDLDDDIDSYFEIEYSSQILHHKAFYSKDSEWVEVDIVKTYNDYTRYHDVGIRLPSGKVIEIDCRDLRFKYNGL